MGIKKKYCDVLSEAIIKSGKTRTTFYTELGIKKSYFYDIIKGNVNPPPREKQLEIIRILNPDKKICIELFETAAKERSEISVDLFLFLDEAQKQNLRKNIEYEKFIQRIKKGEFKNAR